MSSLRAHRGASASGGSSVSSTRTVPFPVVAEAVPPSTDRQAITNPRTEVHRQGGGDAQLLEAAFLATYPLCRVVERKASVSDTTLRSSPSSSASLPDSTPVSRVTFFGTCFAISPVVVLTTAHHYNAAVDIVENFGVAAGIHHATNGVRPVEGGVTLRDVRRGGGSVKRKRDVEPRYVGNAIMDTSSSVDRSRETTVLLLSRAAYLQSSRGFDVMILWLDRPLPYWMALRARFPVARSPLITAWFHGEFTDKPLMTTSGVVKDSSETHCSAQGCVTDKGSSGAPVLCARTGALIGMHLGSSADGDGVHHTEFIPARTLVDLLISAGVQSRLNYYSVS